MHGRGQIDRENFHTTNRPFESNFIFIEIKSKFYRNLQDIFTESV